MVAALTHLPQNARHAGHHNGSSRRPVVAEKSASHLEALPPFRYPWGSFFSDQDDRSDCAERYARAAVDDVAASCGRVGNQTV